MNCVDISKKKGESLYLVGIKWTILVIGKSAQFTVHRYIPLIPLKRIHARNIPQNAVVPYHMRGCDVIPPVDREQHFFLHVFGVGGVILPAGQMAEVCPHGRADRFRHFDYTATPDISNRSKQEKALKTHRFQGFGAGNRT